MSLGSLMMIPIKDTPIFLARKYFGSIKDLPELVEKIRNCDDYHSIPSLSAKKREIFELIEPLHVKVNSMPSIWRKSLQEKSIFRA